MQGHTPDIGDIVLVKQPNGSLLPAIVTSVITHSSVILDVFGIGGMGGSTEPYERGDQPGQWQPKPQ